MANTCIIDPGIGEVDVNGFMTVSPSVTTTYTITAIAPAGSVTSSVTIEVIPPPTINFTISPNTIIEGQTASLEWSTTTAETVTIDNGIGQVDLNGSVQVTPTETTTYTITATGLGGTTTDTKTITVYHIPTVNIFANPNPIIEGATSTLSWNSEYADYCIIEPVIGQVGSNGTISVSPSETTTYTVTAVGPGGSTQALIIVTVYHIPTVQITTDHQTIIEGESAILTWSSKHAATCTIEPGIGSVNANGSISVSPIETTKYTITVAGPGGTATAEANLTVYHVPTATLLISPNSIIEGETATLSWNTDYAETITIEPGIGNVAANGSLTVTPAETTTYTIIVSGPGGTSVKNILLTVNDTSGPPTVNISASPVTITIGSSTQIAWNTRNASKIYIEGIGTVAENGSIIVTPDHTTTYTISATGDGGSSSKKVIVKVLGNLEPQLEDSFGMNYQDLIPPDATVPGYDPERFSVISGLVNNKEGSPISDVSISILGYPEYGTAQTDSEGRYSIPVEGGTYFKVIFEKQGMISSQRNVEVPWNDIVTPETVVMINEDPVSTTFTFDGNPETIVTHKSSEVSDEFGTRSCSMVFTGDNKAYLVDKDGNHIHELKTITTRATEFSTPESMPAKLPANSAYTYCAELSIDGASRVKFEKPVIAYVDNFLGFNVGMAVPVGYYDRDKGVWVPTENGIVVRLLDTNSDGIVDALDKNNDGLADDLDGNGNFNNEVEGLNDPIKYFPNSTFWRISLTHFSPWDANYPYSIPNDAIFPNPEDDPIIDQQEINEIECQNQINSFVEERSRVFHEDIPIPGTDITLHYSSNRVGGYISNVVIPVSGAEVPASLRYIIVKLEVAGRSFEQKIDPLPNKSVEFTWDGSDAFGNRIIGATNARVSIGFVYYMWYSVPGNFQNSFAQAGLDSTDILVRNDFFRWKRETITMYPSVKQQGSTIAEGWTISPHHQVSLKGLPALFMGDGTKKMNYSSLISPIAGTGIRGTDGDGGNAIEAKLSNPNGIVVDREGSLYIVDQTVIRKVDSDGIITRVAGRLTGGWNIQDGIPAVDYSLFNPMDVAVDSIGNFYIADTDNHMISKVDSNGIITTVAGMKNGGYFDNEILASRARFYYPTSIAFDSSDNLYISDQNYHRICKVDKNGILTTVVGIGGTYGRGYSGDGGPATNAKLFSPRGIAIDKDDNLYFADYDNHRIRKVDQSGIITTVAGNGSRGFSGDGGAATEARLYWPTDIAIDSSGNLYIADARNYRIRMVNTKGIITTVAGGNTEYIGWVKGISIDKQDNLYFSYGYNVGILSPVKSLFDAAGDILFSEANNVGHIFALNGYHKKTIDLNTGITLKNFEYDANKKLITVSDQFDNQINIERDVMGIPTAIISPDRIETKLMVDPTTNHLSRVIFPDNSYYKFEYSSKGLMRYEYDPQGNLFEHKYDENGRLTDVFDEEGGHWQYNRQVNEDGSDNVEVITGEGINKSYIDQIDLTGVFTSTITDSTGAETHYSRSANGMVIHKELPCGMDIHTTYEKEPQFKYKYITESTETTSQGIIKKLLRNKSYQDTNSDNKPDLITDTLSLNGKVTTLRQNILSAQNTITSPEGRVITSQYDPANLLLDRVSIPGLFDTNYSYDSRGRLTSIRTETRETIFSYDNQGNVKTITDPEDNITTYSYDEMGRVIAVFRPDTSDLFFNYDNNGSMTVLTNPNGINHNLAFNKVNLTNSYQAPLSGNYSYLYDKDRRLIRKTFPSGKQIYNNYDGGRLSRVQTPDGDIDFTYLCGSKVGTLSKSGETITYEYDGKLVTSETLGGTLNQSLSYTYNNDFNVKTFTFAGVTEQYTYDNDGLLAGAGDYSISRNAQNGLPESVSGGLLSLTRSFNGYGEVDGQSVTISSQSVSSWSVDRDNSGRITSKNETVGGLTSNYAYEYDSMGRLVAVTKDGTLVEEYQYSLNGSREYEMNSLRGIAGRTLNYSDEDHLLTAGDVSYQYDLDGFLTQKGSSADTTSYSYSSRGELIDVNLPDGKYIEYEHDPLGRRIAKRVNGAIVEKYLWQGLTRLLAVYDGSNNLIQRFEYADGRMPVAMIQGGATYYLSYNQVGSLCLVADSSGNVVKRIEYDSFGNIIEDTNPDFKVPFGFAGGLQDRDTDLVRFGYRDYDPDTGRWTAKDPIGFEGGDTDLYGYVLNDPINLMDPWGLWGFKIAAYWGYGGSFAFGKNNGKIFIRAAGGVGIGGGFSYNPEGGIPRLSKASPCDSAEGFIGTSAWAGASLGPLSTGWAGHAGLAISKDLDGRPNLDYVEDSGAYGTVSRNNGWGVKLGGGLNLVDVGLAW